MTTSLRDDTRDLTDLLEELALPPVSTLESVLQEQRQFDALAERDPEFTSGQLGRTPLEIRAGIPSLVRLQHERRMLVRALAPLAALFEGGQEAPANAKRKQHRNVIATMIAKEQNLEGDKQEAKLERLANADSRHVKWCAELDVLRIQYKEALNAVVEKIELIRDRQESLRAYNAQLRANGSAHS